MPGRAAWVPEWFDKGSLSKIKQRYGYKKDRDAFAFINIYMNENLFNESKQKKKGRKTNPFKTGGGLF